MTAKECERVRQAIRRIEKSMQTARWMRTAECDYVSAANVRTLLAFAKRRIKDAEPCPST